MEGVTFQGEQYTEAKHLFSDGVLLCIICSSGFYWSEWSLNCN